ncbi:dephospho-CoA kinase [uncultured Desulfovibrio sp.]|uniref:dephospho-CoA kinase n=1 Tax=uncultured Desulfovibrio sp. TaxID=167968 RepID=UPI002803D0AC|nr:dephospho-CoA kinase [uncultured Desulfovibrio sp.]
MKRLEHAVVPDEDGERLDRILRQALPELSRGAVQRAIRQGCALVDGTAVSAPDFRPRAGQTVCLDLPETESRLVPEAGELCIVHQDRDLIVCRKPAGLTVHPCPSCPEHTLVQRLLGRFPQLARLEGERPGIVHRLDKDTSGLMVVALSEAARLALSDAFARREVHKEYLALVDGLAPEQGECREPLGRHPRLKTRMAVVPAAKGGKTAHTRWRRLWHAPDGGASLLAVRILTGRTHQIRVHFAHMGHPLLGDGVYAPSAVRARAPRQMLHAWRLMFPHPRSGELLEFSAPPPEDFPETILRICRRMERIVITGNPGSGKSALREAMAALHLPTFSADADVAALYAREGEAAAWLRALKGGELLTRDGAVDRQALMEALRNDASFRAELERVVHGLVRRDLENFWETEERSGAPAAVAEVPLYFECGWETAFVPRPVTIGVACPRETRWQRMAAHRHWDEARMAALDAWQWPEARKLGACDLCVDNTGPREALAARAREALNTLAERRRAKEAALRSRLETLWNANAVRIPPPESGD